MILSTFEGVAAIRKSVRERKFERIKAALTAAYAQKTKTAEALDEIRKTKDAYDRKIDKLNTSSVAGMIGAFQATNELNRKLEQAVVADTDALAECDRIKFEANALAEKLDAPSGTLTTLARRAIRAVTDVLLVVAVYSPETFGRYREAIVGLSELARTAL